MLIESFTYGILAHLRGQQRLSAGCIEGTINQYLDYLKSVEARDDLKSFESERQDGMLIIDFLNAIGIVRQTDHLVGSDQELDVITSYLAASWRS